MVVWSINNLLDEQACHDALLSVLHPEGLNCPNGHPLPPDQAPHDRHRAPICDYRCRECGKVFNLFSGTLFQGSHYSCSVWVLLIKGIAQGTPTEHLAKETKVSTKNLLRWRHRLQALIEEVFPPLPAPAGPGHRSRRAVPERRREGRAPRSPRRPAPPSGQPAAGARHL